MAMVAGEDGGPGSRKFQRVLSSFYFEKRLPHADIA